MQPFIRVIRPTGILSFAPDCEPISLNPLNVLIGPNGSGKSNLMELFELLRAAATDLAGAIRDGGGVGEWLWKGEKKTEAGIVNTEIELPNFDTPLRYLLEFDAAGQRLEVLHRKSPLPSASYLWTKPLRMPELDGQGRRTFISTIGFNMAILSSTFVREKRASLSSGD
jgi:energy-coupling factor transporter ATP-binding protein EcfA2